MKRSLVLLAAIIIGLLLAGCSTGTTEPGLLQGSVTIGPIWPVEKEGEEREIPCEVYQARKIMIYDENGRNLLRQVGIDCDGRYRVELAPAVYTVDINRIGVDSSSGLPERVEIMAGTTSRLDIDIDTGIR